MVVADDLRDAIEGGRFKPGDKIPSSNELAAEYDVSPVTVQAAFKALKDEGLLEGRQGAGTFVADQATEGGLVDALRTAIVKGAKTFRYSGAIGEDDRAVLSRLLGQNGWS